MNAKAATLLEAFDGLPAGATVVEIGCVRFPHEIASDGWSTVHLAHAAQARGWRLYSVDIDPSAVRNARSATAGLPISVHLARGSEWLAGFAGPIDGLYLDGAAYPDEAVAQYEAANLSVGAVIAIDDIQPIVDQRLGIAAERGKGDLLLDVLDRDGWTVMIVDTVPGYRMAVASR